MNARRLLVAAVAVLAAGTPARAAGGILVFAAASLTNAIEAVAIHCAAETPDAIRTSFAASSVLAKQIDHGAPAQVYVSANAAWMDYLDDRGLLADGSRRRIAANRLVLVAPAGSPLPADLGVAGAIAAAGSDGRVALGDPDHVPAGVYAKAALRSVRAWETVRARAARTANVRVALALVETGAVPLGIVYATDTRESRRVRVVAEFPADSHPPIVYEAALVAGGDTPAARRGLACLGGAEAGAIFARHGFAAPPEGDHADTR